MDQWKKDLNVKVYDDKLQEGLKISKQFLLRLMEVIP